MKSLSILTARFLFILLVVCSTRSIAQRIPVLNQVDLPHNYYFRELYVPQLTSGLSSAAWVNDGKTLIYSMGGSLWQQSIDSEHAVQLTDGPGYDYQPDVSPDGTSIVFVRYTGESMELMILNRSTKETRPLTNNLAVNLEPRWSPDGKQIAFVSTQNTNHFLLYTASIDNYQLKNITCLTPDRKSETKRYYYSAWDHAINPVWSRDGKKIYYVSNREVAHGTGNLVAIDIESKTIQTLHQEETSWRMKPDISPDGTRLVYSSYHGRNWHQLWMLPTEVGYAMPLTYGEYDNTMPRWSPNGKNIAFISNRLGNTSLWIVNVYDGFQRQIVAKTKEYLQSRTSLTISVRDENGKEIPSRISINDQREKFYAPSNAWIHADDSRYPKTHRFESHYFHSNGSVALEVPLDKLQIKVSHGPLYESVQHEVDATQPLANPVIITLKKLSLPNQTGNWWSGDVHVHMNYTGNYRNTPEKLALQAKAEDLNLVYNLIVNKEQRIPDIDYFSSMPDPVSDEETQILHGQEFHTSIWGHLGLLNLKDHFILPDYAGYPQTAAASVFPHNAFVADRAHDQQGLVGYVHPFEQSEIFPDQSPNLVNELPVDAALGKIDYYELVGFSDHKASEAVWYHLLNAGFRLPAAAGTDAMANYSSLRGPLGLNRTYVKAEGALNHETFQLKLKEGKSFVTNGPIIGLAINNASPGDQMNIERTGKNVSYSAFLRSNVPVKYFEIIYNGDVVARHMLNGTRQELDVIGKLKLKESGWILLRAWSDEAHPDCFDLYPYASTNPIYVTGTQSNSKQKTAGAYFLKWVERIEQKLNDLPFRNEDEKEWVTRDVLNAKEYYQKLVIAR
ncbi:MAG: CehA/McbA family metallohydrolase [Cyclobacteriaceae bacterium]|nr:CehA/McbA family metallohydrolase [Cyclobacteriaceae bacterium]